MNAKTKENSPFLKKEPIDNILGPIYSFIKLEASGSIVLFICAAAAMILANSPLSELYFAFWHYDISLTFGPYELKQDLHHWINDGLMGIFFFVIGLEIKREVMGGELSSFKKAILPFAAGIGGMLFPALLFVAFNLGGEGKAGWGIPMATDIAFALGILAILGRSIPFSLKIFLTALAIADDLGAVLVIAFFYTSEIHFTVLLIGAGILGVMILLNKLGVRNTVAYGILGIGGLWLAFMLSGVHATLAGVLAAFAIPARTKIKKPLFQEKMGILLNKFTESKETSDSLISGEQLHVLEKMRNTVRASETPLQRLEHGMHGLVIYVVMPIFALANAGVIINAQLLSYFNAPITLGIIAGLTLGKFIGIVLMTRIMVKLKWAELPQNCSWLHIYGVALLAGVGFTMSLFITKLAFEDPIMIAQAKLGVITASLLAGFVGYGILKMAIRKSRKEITEELSMVKKVADPRVSES